MVAVAWEMKSQTRQKDVIGESIAFNKGDLGGSRGDERGGSFTAIRQQRLALTTWYRSAKQPWMPPQASCWDEASQSERVAGSHQRRNCETTCCRLLTNLTVKSSRHNWTKADRPEQYDSQKQKQAVHVV